MPLLELTEYEPKRFDANMLPQKLGTALWRNYSKQIDVEFPSPKTEGLWELRSRGWVGHIPLSPEVAISLHPRVALRNLFGMWEYAYQLKSFHFLEGLFDCDSLEEFYTRLAAILARRILDRSRKGFYRAYISTEEHAPAIRGRLNIPLHVRSPWSVQLPCQYEEHTGDVEENRILAWTLYTILHSGLCYGTVIPLVRQAYHVLQGFVSLQPYHSTACINRRYNRLNEDYAPLHAICRFFLEHSGPSHEHGDHTMLPFLVFMPGLYELFVAEWLRAHLPHDLRLTTQERHYFDESERMAFRIDVMIYEGASQTPYAVLDTKYKSAQTPTNADFSQVGMYALKKNCQEAILVYPATLVPPLNEEIGPVRIRSLTFALDGDLEQAGQAFLQELLHIRTPLIAA
jgi:5-methylcytosine-specific restriction enzyme subunit McrC